MNKCRKKLHRISMTLIFTAIVFGNMLISMLIVLGVIRIFLHFGLVIYPETILQPLVVFSLGSLLVGVFMAIFISRRPLKPWYALTNAANEIADGNYNVRVQTKGPEAVQKLFDSFNHMAEELGSVEMLRSDFVNNFSHEFKTPIVSIRGFAKMLKRSDLTEEERDEYLDIIINESERLSELAGNVLNLSKIEQQTILTEKQKFNVSEQIRLVIAMMLSKWRDKQVDISLEGGEVYLIGNEELMQQVWMNLLDNAIKFSPNKVAIQISITQTEKSICVTVTDQGLGMSSEIMDHIFDKFYQGDSSHAEKGNGLGLAIVKKVITLHKGQIHVSSQEGVGSEFLVEFSTRNS